MAATFTALGASASLLGRLMGTSSPWWFIALGILMLLMALQILGVFEFVPSTRFLSRSSRRGYFGAFLAGVLGGFFSSPCATPVLVVLLGLVAKSGDVGMGIFLLLLYSLGHSVLVLAAGTSTSFVAKIASSDKYGFFSTVVLPVLPGILTHTSRFDGKRGPGIRRSRGLGLLGASGAFPLLQQRQQ
jgi:cytochrome c biogenesis protein CcdA